MGTSRDRESRQTSSDVPAAKARGCLRDADAARLQGINLNVNMFRKLGSRKPASIKVERG